MTDLPEKAIGWRVEAQAAAEAAFLEHYVTQKRLAFESTVIAVGAALDVAERALATTPHIGAVTGDREKIIAALQSKWRDLGLGIMAGYEAGKLADAVLSLTVPACGGAEGDSPRGFEHLARQFDLMAKGCRSLGLDSQEDDWDSRRQDANRAVVDPETIVEAIDYDYRNGHDGRAATTLLIDALCKDLRALSSAPPQAEQGKALTAGQCDVS